MSFAQNFLGGFWPTEKDAQFTDTYNGTKYTLGQKVAGWDPYWGHAEFIFVQFQTASTLITPGRVVTWSNTWLIALEGSVANSGRPIGIVASRFPSDATVSASNPLYGWVQVSGFCPATFSVAATAGTVFLGTSGNLTPTAAAGKQVLNARTEIAATGTITRTGWTKNGSNILTLSDRGGFYVGGIVSGTGIPGGTSITTMDTGSNNTVVMSANATATGTITVTLTNTGYGIVYINQPFGQGQIT